MKLPPKWSAAWARLAPREKLMVAGASALILLALLWWVAAAPPEAPRPNAETQHRELAARLARMRSLQQQAKALQAQPKLNPDDAARELEATVRQRLGTTARMVIAGDRVTLTLNATPADALAGWLAQARVNARALPTEAKLTRNAAGAWDGTIVLALPPR